MWCRLGGGAATATVFTPLGPQVSNERQDGSRSQSGSDVVYNWRRLVTDTGACACAPSSVGHNKDMWEFWQCK